MVIKKILNLSLFLFLLTGLLLFESGCTNSTEIGRARPECLLNSDCEEHKICILGYCSEKCIEARDCPNGLVCTEGSCVPGNVEDILETSDGIEEDTALLPDSEIPQDTLEPSDTLPETNEIDEFETITDSVEDEEAEVEVLEPSDPGSLYGKCDIYGGCAQGNCLVAVGAQSGFCTVDCTDLCPDDPLGGTYQCLTPIGYETSTPVCTINCLDDSSCMEGLSCQNNMCLPALLRNTQAYGVCDDRNACETGKCITGPFSSAGTCAPICSGQCTIPAPEGVQAIPSCLTEGYCMLNCTGNLTCPANHTCIPSSTGIQYCYATGQGNPTAAPYQRCDNVYTSCLDGNCRVFGPAQGVCASTCNVTIPCPESSSGLIPECVSDIGIEFRCFLSCLENQQCPTGRLCDTTALKCH